MSRIMKIFIGSLSTILFLFAVTAYAASSDVLFHHSGDPVGGNPNGKVTIVEFFDYQCGHCIAMAPVMQNIIQHNPDVRVVYKEFPIRRGMSELAAKAALAANEQGKYASFSHALLSVNQPLTPALIFSLAQNAGINVKKLKQDMNSKNIQNQINTTKQLAAALNIPGTPAFFIGKTNVVNGQFQFVPGEMSQSELQDAINKASQ